MRGGKVGNDVTYIMVTHFSGYWDKIPSHKDPSYPPAMFREGLTQEKLINNTPTVFVKVTGKNSGQVERAWHGYVRNIRRERSDGKYYFSVEITSEEKDTGRYQGLKNGWYLNKPSSPRKGDQQEILRPPFFAVLRTTKKWEEFQQWVPYLLKLLGINVIYSFPSDQQSGRSDGFFRLGKLAVIYDCTLESDFAERKKVQIDNYCSQLEGGSIVIDAKTTEDIRLYDKQVWIITRGHDCVIHRKSEVVVREVSIHKLIEIYEYRLRHINTERDLESKLKETIA